jgi:hypothetical protein
VRALGYSDCERVHEPHRYVEALCICEHDANRVSKLATRL